MSWRVHYWLYYTLRLNAVPFEKKDNNIRLLEKLEYDQNYFNQMYLWKINLKIVTLF